MKFISQSISGLMVIEPTFYNDDRGYFAETFRHDLFEEAIGYKINFIQDNESKSSKGVLRGLHYQVYPHTQSKLVKVIEGSILDVAVDIRKPSPTFGKYISLELTAENKRQLFIPKGFAHGFVVLSDNATIVYKVDNYYAPEHDRGIIFNDKTIDIKWKLPADLLHLSDKDKNQPTLDIARDLFK